MQHPATLTLQKWGNSLAVRIPSALARSGHFSVGQPIEMSLMDAHLIMTPVGTPKLSLSQKLALFDPIKHRGEAMATTRIGAEVFE